MAWTQPPRTWVTDEVPSAATLNTHIRDQFIALSDFVSYSPTLSNWTLGNGTIDGRALMAGSRVDLYIKLTFGSTTSAAGGGPGFTLPVTAALNRGLVGSVLFYDSSGPAYFGGWAFAGNTTSITHIRTDSSATPGTTVPFTWATGDELVINGTYEAA